MPRHPYYPRYLELENYQVNQYSTLQLFMVAGGILCPVAIGAFYVASRKKRDGALYFVWFIICGLLHCGFESYWLLNHSHIASRSDLLAELWKEYAHGDSRYLNSDPLLIALETITIFIWGPLCFVSAWTWWHNSPRHIFYQFLVSVGHLYSCSLYFILDIPTGFKHCDPHPYYFWLYFVAFNAPWVIIPCSLIYRNTCHILRSLDSSILHPTTSIKND
ncbi:unnamed protein product [Absidia cylindrospora]